MELPDETEQPGTSSRAKAVLVAVVTIVVLATLVLCCVAASQLGVLIQLRRPPP